MYRTHRLQWQGVLLAIAALRSAVRPRCTAIVVSSDSTVTAIEHNVAATTHGVFIASS